MHPMQNIGDYLHRWPLDLERSLAVVVILVAKVCYKMDTVSI